MKNRKRLILAGVTLFLFGGVVLAESVNLKNENNSSFYETKEASRLIEAFKIGLKKSKETYPDIDTVSYLTTLYWNIGNSYLEQYNNEKAIKFYKKAIEIKPTDARVYNSLGIIYARKNNYTKAIEFYSKAIDMNPKGDAYYFNKGLIYSDKKEYDKAINLFNNAIELNAYYEKAYCSLANVYNKKKEYEKSISFYNKAIEINPQSYLSYINIFEIQLVQNRLFSAELEKKYKELFKDNKETLIHYDLLKIAQGISQNREVNLEKWKEKYHQTYLWDGNFTNLDEWINHIDNNKTKKELQKAIALFKKHQDNSVYPIYDDRNITYSEPQIVDEKLEDEKILISNIISIVPAFYDAKNNIFIKDWNYLKGIDNRLKSDKAFILECSKLGVDIFVFMDNELKKDKEFALSLLNQSEDAISINMSLNSNGTLIKSYSSQAYILSHLDDSLRNDKDFVYPFIEKNPKFLDAVGEKLKSDRDFITSILTKFGYGLEYATKEQQSNRELVLNAVKHYGLQLKFVDKSLIKNKEILLKAIEHSDILLSKSALDFIDDDLKKDKAFIGIILSLSPSNFIYIDKSLREDKSFILEMLKEGLFIFDYIDEKFKKDRDVALAVIRQHPLLDSYVDDSKEPSLNLMDGDLAIFYESKYNIFKNDRTFITEIIKHTPFFMETIEPHFKKDKEFLLTALKESGSHFKAPKVSSPFVTMIDESLKQDKAFITKVLDIEPRLFKYIDESLQKDKEIVALIEEIKHPLWKKIFTPLNILLILLFGHWCRGRLQSHRLKRNKKEKK